MDPHRLTTNPPELGGIGDRAGARSIVHVAQTARREPHSGLVSRLKESERAQPQRKECEEAPGARCAQDYQQDHEQRGCGERDESESTPLRLTAWSDVRDGCDG